MKYYQEKYIFARKTQVFMIFAGFTLACWTGWGLTSQADPVGTVMGWIGVIVGLFFFWAGLYNRKVYSRFPRYRELILTQGVRSIDRLAPLIGVSTKTAQLDVKAMISQNILLEARLSPNGEITEESYVQTPPSQTPPVGTDLLCPGCGAMNESDKEQCIFCGRTLRH